VCVCAGGDSFFSGLAIPPHGVHIVCTYDGRASGEAYVEFINDEQMIAALKKNKELMNGRYIEVFPCQRRDFQYALTHHLVISGGGVSSSSSSSSPSPSLSPSSLSTTSGPTQSNHDSSLNLTTKELRPSHRRYVLY
jgi:hypothetical protein